MVSKVDGFSEFAEVCVFFTQLELVPQLVSQSLAIFRNLSPEDHCELREAQGTRSLVIEEVEEGTRFCGCDIDSLVSDHLLELLIAEQCVSVEVSVL